MKGVLKMRKDLTELVFIIDRSGSMGGLESDTIGGFNNMVKKQQKEKGEAIVSTVLFDNAYEVLHDQSDIEKIKALTGEEYYVRGSTALLDAIGMTISSIVKRQEHGISDFLPENTIVVIITDGHENSSQQYTLKEIKKLIKDAESNRKWEFVFLGANIDAVSVANDMGIREDNAANFSATHDGVRESYGIISDVVSDFRKEKVVRKGWKSKMK